MRLSTRERSVSCVRNQCSCCAVLGRSARRASPTTFTFERAEQDLVAGGGVQTAGLRAARARGRQRDRAAAPSGG